MYEVAKEMYLKGISMRQIEKEIGFDRKKLSQMLINDGVKVLSRGLTKGTQKYTHNTNVFKDIDNEEKAYWLGFLYADGNIYPPRGQIELCLADKDVKHLEIFRDFISPDSPIKKRIISLANNEYIAWRVQINSMEIVHDLIGKGCIPNKSLKIAFPKDSIIPKHLVHHFIRGYFDGDGSAIMRKEKRWRDQAVVQIIGTKPFLHTVVKHLSDAGISDNNKYYHKGNAFSYHLVGNRNYDKFHKYIYYNATIYLKRKCLIPVAHVKPGELLEPLT
ncbi:LAGLIDADG family homing endonuclease [Cytobacillus oceanisediminis]|uniref:LAGLIDADG family homing endonuclease n=1 Tax=Cytobacillus oceanisediminis TaxID=665099 RepID=UPI001863F34B|nr:LAGLIDADG family homing endonuclease [Cytobacillus oceanisediminis]MCM3402963.1 hypothetical protein [Cytobacillus oceanisediminis]QOK30035.1 hypothetical protein IIE26_27085 [Cytobacillus oceanisediminis]